MSSESSAYFIRKLGERRDKDEARARDAGTKAAAALEKACSAVNAYLLACIRAGHPDDRGRSDSRRRLMEDMSEYADYLERIYGRD